MELVEEKIKISLGGEVSTIMLYASVPITNRKHGSTCASLMHLKLSSLKSWNHFIHFFLSKNVLNWMVITFSTLLRIRSIEKVYWQLIATIFYSFFLFSYLLLSHQLQQVISDTCLSSPPKFVQIFLCSWSSRGHVPVGR